MSNFRYFFGEQKDKDNKYQDGKGVIQINKRNRVPKKTETIGTPMKFFFNEDNIDYNLNNSNGIKLSIGGNLHEPSKDSADITLSSQTLVLKSFEVQDNVKIDKVDIIFKNKNETINKFLNNNETISRDYYLLNNSNRNLDIYYKHGTSKHYYNTIKWFDTNTITRPFILYNENFSIVNNYSDISYNYLSTISYDKQPDNEQYYFINNDVNQNRHTFIINNYNSVTFTINNFHKLFTNDDNDYILKRWGDLTNYNFKTYDNPDLSGNFIFKTWAQINNEMNANLFTSIDNNELLDEYNNFQKTDRNIFLYDTRNIDSFQKQKKIIKLSEIDSTTNSNFEGFKNNPNDAKLDCLAWIKIKYQGNDYFIQNVDIYKINAYAHFRIFIDENYFFIGSNYIKNELEYTSVKKTANINSTSSLNLDLLTKNFNYNVNEITNNNNTNDFYINEELTLHVKSNIFTNLEDLTKYNRLNSAHIYEFSNVNKKTEDINKIFTNLEDAPPEGDPLHSNTVFYNIHDAKYYINEKYKNILAGLFTETGTQALEYIKFLKNTTVLTKFYSSINDLLNKQNETSINWNNVTSGSEFYNNNIDISFYSPNDVNNLQNELSSSDISNGSIGVLNTHKYLLYFLNERCSSSIFDKNILFNINSKAIIDDTLKELKKTNFTTTLYNLDGIPTDSVIDKITNLSTNGVILWSDILDNNIKFYKNDSSTEINKPNLNEQYYNNDILNTESWGEITIFNNYNNNNKIITLSSSKLYFKNFTKNLNLNNWIVFRETIGSTDKYYYYRNLLHSQIKFYNKDFYEKGRLDVKGVDIYEKINGSRLDPVRKTAESLDDVIMSSHLPNKFMYHNFLDKPLALTIDSESQTDRIIIKWVNLKQYGTSVPVKGDDEFNHVDGYLYMPVINDIYIEYIPVSRMYTDVELSQEGWWENVGVYSINSQQKEVPKKILIGGKKLLDSSNNYINIPLFTKIEQLSGRRGEKWIQNNLKKKIRDTYNNIKRVSELGSSELINPTLETDFRGFYDKSIFIYGQQITNADIIEYISSNSNNNKNSWSTELQAGNEILDEQFGWSSSFTLSPGLIILDINSKHNAFKVNIDGNFRWFKNAIHRTREHVIRVSPSNPNGYIFMHTILRFYYKSTSSTIDIYNKSTTQQQVSKFMTNQVIFYTQSSTSINTEIDIDSQAEASYPWLDDGANSVVFHTRGLININNNKIFNDVYHPTLGTKLQSALSYNNILNEQGNVTGGYYVPIIPEQKYAFRIYIDNNDPDSDINYSNIRISGTSITGKPTPPGQNTGLDNYEEHSLKLTKQINTPFLNISFKTPVDNDDLNSIINGKIVPNAFTQNSNNIPSDNLSEIPYIEHYFINYFESTNFKNHWTPPLNEYPYRQHEGEPIFFNKKSLFNKKLLIGCQFMVESDLQNKQDKLNGLTVYNVSTLFPTKIDNSLEIRSYNYDYVLDISRDSPSIDTNHVSMNRVFTMLLDNDYKFLIYKTMSNLNDYITKNAHDLSNNRLKFINNDWLQLVNNDFMGYNYIYNRSNGLNMHTFTDNDFIPSSTNISLHVFDNEHDARHYAYTSDIYGTENVQFRDSKKTKDKNFTDNHWIAIKDNRDQSWKTKYYYFRNNNQKNILLSSGENKQITNDIINNIYSNGIKIFENLSNAQNYLISPLSIPSDVNRITGYGIDTIDNEITDYPMFNKCWGDNLTKLNNVNSELNQFKNLDIKPYDIFDLKFQIENKGNNLKEKLKFTQLDTSAISQNNLIITDSNKIHKTNGISDNNNYIRVLYKNQHRYIKNNLLFNENYWLAIRYNEEKTIFESLASANSALFTISGNTNSQDNDIITFNNGISTNIYDVNGSNDTGSEFQLGNNYTINMSYNLITLTDSIITTNNFKLNNLFRHYFYNIDDVLNPNCNYINPYIDNILKRISGLNVLSVTYLSSDNPYNALSNNHNLFSSIPLYVSSNRSNVIFELFESRSDAAEFVNTKGGIRSKIKTTTKDIYPFTYWIVIIDTMDATKTVYYYFQNTPCDNYGLVQNTEITRRGTLYNSNGSLLETKNGLLNEPISTEFNIFNKHIFNQNINNYSSAINITAKNLSNVNESEFKPILTSILKTDTVNDLDIMPPSKPLGWSGKNDTSYNIFYNSDDLSNNWNYCNNFIGIEYNHILTSSTNDFIIPIYKTNDQLNNLEHLYQHITFYKSDTSIPNIENTNREYYTNNTGKLYIFDNEISAKIFAQQSQSKVDNNNVYISKNIDQTITIDTSYNINHWIVYEREGSDNKNDYYYFQNKTDLAGNNTSRVYNVSWNSNKDTIYQTLIRDTSNNLYTSSQTISGIIKIENAHDYIYIKNVSRPSIRFIDDNLIDISWSKPEFTSKHYNNLKNLKENHIDIHYYRLYRNQTRWSSNKIDQNYKWIQGLGISGQSGWENGEIYEYYFNDISLTWIQHELIAKTMGSNIASIGTYNENEFVISDKLSNGDTIWNGYYYNTDVKLPIWNDYNFNESDDLYDNVWIKPFINGITEPTNLKQFTYIKTDKKWDISDNNGKTKAVYKRKIPHDNIVLNNNANKLFDYISGNSIFYNDKNIYDDWDNNKYLIKQLYGPPFQNTLTITENIIDITKDSNLLYFTNNSEKSFIFNKLKNSTKIIDLYDNSNCTTFFKHDYWCKVESIVIFKINENYDNDHSGPYNETFNLKVTISGEDKFTKNTDPQFILNYNISFKKYSGQSENNFETSLLGSWNNDMNDLDIINKFYIFNLVRKTIFSPSPTIEIKNYFINCDPVLNKNTYNYVYKINDFNGKRSLSHNNDQVVNIDTNSDNDDHNLTLEKHRGFSFDLTCENYLLSKTSIFSNPSYYLFARVPDKPLNLTAVLEHTNNNRYQNKIKISWKKPINTGETYNATHYNNGLKKGDKLNIKRYIVEYSNNNSFTNKNSWILIKGSENDNRIDNVNEWSRTQSVGNQPFITIDGDLNNSLEDLSVSVLVNNDKTIINEPANYQFRVKCKNHFISNNTENSYDKDWYTIGYSHYNTSDESYITSSVPETMHFIETKIVNNGIQITFANTSDSYKVTTDMNYYKHPERYQSYNTVPWRDFWVKNWTSNFNHINENKFNQSGLWDESDNNIGSYLYESNYNDWNNKVFKPTHTINNDVNTYNSIPNERYHNRLFYEYQYSYKVYGRNMFNKYFNNNESDEINGIHPNLFVTSYIEPPKLNVNNSPNITFSSNKVYVNLHEPENRIKDTYGNNNPYNDKLFSFVKDIYDIGKWNYLKYSIVKYHHDYNYIPTNNSSKYNSPDNNPFVNVSGEHFHNIPFIDMTYNIYVENGSGKVLQYMEINNNVSLNANSIIEISGNHNQLYIRDSNDLLKDSNRRKYLEQYDIQLVRFNKNLTNMTNLETLPSPEYVKWHDISNKILTISETISPSNTTYSNITWFKYENGSDISYIQNNHSGFINNNYSGNIFSYMVETGTNNKASYLKNIYAYNSDKIKIQITSHVNDNSGQIFVFNNLNDAKIYCLEMTKNGISRIKPCEGSGNLNIHNGIVYYDNTNYYYLPNKNLGHSHFGFFRNRCIHKNNTTLNQKLSYCKIWNECSNVLCLSGNLQSEESINQWKVNLNGHKMSKYYINNGTGTKLWTNDNDLITVFTSVNDCKYLNNLDGITMWRSNGILLPPEGPLKFNSGYFDGSISTYGISESHTNNYEPVMQPNKSVRCFKNRIIAQKYADLIKDGDHRWKTLISENFSNNSDFWFVLRLDQEYYYFRNKVEDLYFNGITTNTNVNITKYNDMPLNKTPSLNDNTGSSNSSVLFSNVETLHKLSILNKSVLSDIDAKVITWNNGNNPITSNITYTETLSSQFSGIEDQNNPKFKLFNFENRENAIEYAKKNTLFKNLSQIYSVNDNDRKDIFNYIKNSSATHSYDTNITQIMPPGNHDNYNLPTDGYFDFYKNFTIKFNNVTNLQSYLSLVPNKNSIQMNGTTFSSHIETDLPFGRYSVCGHIFSNIEELEIGSPMRRALEDANGEIICEGGSQYYEKVYWKDLKDCIITYYIKNQSIDYYDENTVFELNWNIDNPKPSNIGEIRYLNNRIGIVNYYIINNNQRLYTNYGGANVPSLAYELNSIIEIEYYDRYKYHKLFFENREYSYIKVFNNEKEANYYKDNWKTCNKGIWNGQKSIKDSSGISNYNLTVNNWLVFNNGGNTISFNNKYTISTYSNINLQTNWLVLEDTRNSSSSVPDKYTIFRNVRTDYEKHHWLFVQINNNYYRLMNIKNNTFINDINNLPTTIDLTGIELYEWDSGNSLWNISGTFDDSTANVSNENIKFCTNQEITNVSTNSYQGCVPNKDPGLITQLNTGDNKLSLSNIWVVCELNSKNYTFKNKKEYHLFGRYDDDKQLTIDNIQNNDNPNWKGKEIDKLEKDKIYQIKYKVRNQLNKYYTRLSNPKYIQMTPPLAPSASDTNTLGSLFNNKITITLINNTNLGFNNDWPNISTNNQPSRLDYTINLTISGQIFRNRFDLQANWGTLKKLISQVSLPTSIDDDDNIIVINDSIEYIDNYNITYGQYDTIKITKDGIEYEFINSRIDTYSQTNNNVFICDGSTLFILPGDTYWYDIVITNQYLGNGDKSIKYYSPIKFVDNINYKQNQKNHLNVNKIPNFSLGNGDEYTNNINTGNNKLVQNGGMKGHILLDTMDQENGRILTKKYKINQTENYNLVYNVSERVDIWNINQYTNISSSLSESLNLNINGSEYTDTYKSYTLPPKISKIASDKTDTDYINNDSQISYDYINQIGLGGSSQTDKDVGTLHLRIRFNRNLEHMYNAPLSFDNNVPNITSHFFNGDGNWIIGDWSHLGFVSTMTNQTYNYDISNSYLTSNGVTNENKNNVYTITLNNIKDNLSNKSYQKGSWYDGRISYDIDLSKFRNLGFLGVRLDIVIDAYYGKGSNVKSINPKLIGVDQFISKRISYRNEGYTDRSLFFDDLNSNHTIPNFNSSSYTKSGSWPEIYTFNGSDKTVETYSVNGQVINTNSNTFKEKAEIKHYKVIGIPMLRPKRNKDITGNEAYYKQNKTSSFPHNTLDTNRENSDWTPTEEIITHIKLWFIIDKNSDFFVPKTLANLYFRETYLNSSKTSAISSRWPQRYDEDFIKYSRDMFSGDILLDTNDIENTKGNSGSITQDTYKVGRHCANGTDQLSSDIESTHYYRCAKYFKGKKNENYWEIKNLDIQSENILKLNDWHGRQLHYDEFNSGRNDKYFPNRTTQYTNTNIRGHYNGSNETSLLKTNIIIELQTHTIFNSYKFDPFEGHYFIYDHRTFDLLNYFDNQHIDKIEDSPLKYLTHSSRHYRTKSDSEGGYKISNIYHIYVPNDFHINDSNSNVPGYFNSIFKGENINYHYHRNDTELKSQLLIFKGMYCTPKYFFDELKLASNNKRLNDMTEEQIRQYYFINSHIATDATISSGYRYCIFKSILISNMSNSSTQVKVGNPVSITLVNTNIGYPDIYNEENVVLFIKYRFEKSTSNESHWIRLSGQNLQGSDGQSVYSQAGTWGGETQNSGIASLRHESQTQAAIATKSSDNFTGTGNNFNNPDFNEGNMITIKSFINTGTATGSLVITGNNINAQDQTNNTNDIGSTYKERIIFYVAVGLKNNYSGFIESININF